MSRSGFRKAVAWVLLSLGGAICACTSSRIPLVVRMGHPLGVIRVDLSSPGSEDECQVELPGRQHEFMLMLCLEEPSVFPSGRSAIGRPHEGNGEVSVTLSRPDGSPCYSLPVAETAFMQYETWTVPCGDRRRVRAYGLFPYGMHGWGNGHFIVNVEVTEPFVQRQPGRAVITVRQDPSLLPLALISMGLFGMLSLGLGIALLATINGGYRARRPRP